jgi:hypothetical protein
MAHNNRLAADSFYFVAVPLPSSWWQGLDNAQLKAVNGDAGGTWSPAASLQIDNANLPLWTPGATPTGNMFAVWLTGPSTITIPGSVNDPISHGDSDYVQLGSGHAGSSRTIVTACSGGIDNSDGGGIISYYEPVAAMYCIQPGARFVMMLEVHHGATLASAVFSFYVTQSHVAGGPPANLPTFRIVAVEVATGIVTALGSGYGAVGTATYSPAPVSGAAWFTDMPGSSSPGPGTPHTFTYAIAPMTVIDTSRFIYMAEIVDESGANAKFGNVYTKVTVGFSGIQDLRPQ